MKIPTFIISYNRPKHLERCIASLQDERLQIVIVSNDGKKYSPKKTDNPMSQILMSENCLHNVVWTQGIAPQDRPYIVTDCDIVAPDNDWLDVLMQGMERLPQYNKFGLGLNSNNNQSAYEHEKNLYKKPVDSLFDECPVDTTLALYRQGFTKYSIWGNNSPIKFTGECRSVRSRDPYLGDHLTWGMDEELKKEHKEYQKTIDNRITHWSKLCA